MTMRWWRQQRDPALFALVVLAALRIQGAEPRAAGDGSDYVVTAWDIGEGLPDSTVSAIVQSSDGYLWLGTFGGLVRFNGLTFKVFDPSNTPALPSAGVVSLHHTAIRQYYLLQGEGWLSAPDVLKGPWSPVQNLPPSQAISKPRVLANTNPPARAGVVDPPPHAPRAGVPAVDVPAEGGES
jgi:hypothetical protein